MRRGSLQPNPVSIMDGRGGLAVEQIDALWALAPKLGCW